jgi:sarcosine oxidase
MNQSFDVIIIGLGAMGSASAFHLAKRGRKILGLERFGPAHNLGSSHGETRIIREAYFESPVYVPIVRRAYELWRELEVETGRRFLQETGGLMIGPAEGVLVQGAKRSAVQHGLPYQWLSSEEIKKRFPAINPLNDWVAVWEPRAGILKPHLCIEAHLDMAEKYGAALHFDEPVVRWKPVANAIEVMTAQDTYRAERLLVTAGAWAATLLEELSLPLQVARQVLFWFEPVRNNERLLPDHLPVFMIEFEKDRIFYGFPDVGTGVKVAIHHEGEHTDADHVRRSVQIEEGTELQSLMSRFLPDAAGKILNSEVCMYTNTPDGHFLIDFHPHHRQVLIASPCSGHGFKFSSAIGELLADLLTTGKKQFDLNPFQMDRFPHSES